MPSLIADSFIEEIRTSSDIVEIISEYLILKKKGRNYLGTCPFHSEKTPSFTVSAEKQIFHCFGCQAGGDIFRFVMRMEGLTFPQAVERLAARSGISLPEEPVSPGEKQKQLRREKMLKLLGNAATFYGEQLLAANGATAHRYLEERGINPETARIFRLGWAPPDWDNLLNHLTRQGHNPEELLAAGLVMARENKSGYYDRFRGRLMFPICDVQGRVVAFGGRVLAEGEPKYLNSPEGEVYHKGKLLYGINYAGRAIRDRGYAIIVEGYMDLISAHQAGFTNTVASLGTALTRDQAKLLLRYSDQAAIAYDADTAGANAAMRGLDILREVGCRVRVARFQGGKDPDEIIRNFGPDYFRQAVEDQALPLVEYKFSVLAAKLPVDKTEGKADLVRALAPDLQKTNNLVEREEYIKFLAKRLNIDEHAIRGELARQRSETPAKTVQDMKKQTTHTKSGFPVPVGGMPLGKVYPAHRRAEEELLKLMFQLPDIAGQIAAELDEGNLLSPPLQEVFRCYRELAVAGAVPDLTAVLASLTSEEAGSVLTRIMLEDQIPDVDPKAVQDYFRAIRRHHIQQEIAEIQQRLTQTTEDQATALAGRFFMLRQELEALKR